MSRVLSPASAPLTILGLLGITLATSCFILPSGDKDDSTDEDEEDDPFGWGDDGGDDGGGDSGVDEDGDGYNASEDCDDSDSSVYPGADEACDGVDNDCDGDIDEDGFSTWYVDDDGDGYGDPVYSLESCDPPDGYVSNDDDCDDNRTDVNPGASEVCDGRDNDCNGDIDDDPVDGSAFFEDKDGDGFGKAGTEYLACDGATNDWDCNDSDSTEPQYVKAGATGAENGSLSNPWNTIQEGIDRASDCVLVAPGTYSGAVDFRGANIEVSSTGGAAATILDGSTLSGKAVVTFKTGEGAGAVLDGFTIRNGRGFLEESSTTTSCASDYTCTDYFSTYCGGGIYADGADPTLRNLVLTSNVLPDASSTASGNDTYYVYSYGGAGCFLSSNATLSGLTVNDNKADQGGAFYVDAYSAVEISQSEVYENDANDAGGIQVDQGSLSLTNVIVTANSATNNTGGGVMVVGGSLVVENSTVVGDDGSALYLTDNGTASVTSSILAYTYDGYGVYVAPGSSFTGRYNNVFGNNDGEYSGITNPTGTNGNISSNPSFVSWSNNLDYADDLNLKSTSPSVNAGDPSTAKKDADGSANDQGAYGGPDGSW